MAVKHAIFARWVDDQNDLSHKETSGSDKNNPKPP